MTIKSSLIKLFVLNLSQVIIEKFFKVCKKRIIFLREERIGHQLGNYECSIKEAISFKKKNIKTIFIFYEKPSQVANIYARQLIIKNAKKNKFRIIQCDENFSLIRLFIKKIACNFNHSKSNFFVMETTNLCKLGKKPLIRSSNFLSKIKKDLQIKFDKYICIYSRDDKYLSERFPNEDFTYHNYRNSSIDKYQLLAKNLDKNTDIGIIRMGSKPEKPIKWNVNYENIIDYPFTKFQSDRNDIELIAGCDLFISSGGGLESIAIASRRKIIAINQIPLALAYGLPVRLFIPKLLLDKKTNKFLTMKEIYERKLMRTLNSNDYYNSNIEVIENSEDEILNIYLDHLKQQNNSFTNEDLNLIKEFIEIRDQLHKNNSLSRVMNNIVAPSFLRKHYNFLC